jgi:hypothetical protein
MRLSSHPIYPKPSPDITTRIYNPVFPTYWQKSPDNYAVKSRDYHCATYTYIGPEWFKAPPKDYATYKEPLRQSGGYSNVCCFFLIDELDLLIHLESSTANCAESNLVKL